MGERDRIARYFAPLAATESGSFGLTDDAAILTPPAGKQLVITTDSVIETIHVLAAATPQQFAQKLMRRNLSDLAAMGAVPWRYTLNLHTPRDLAEAWYADFAASLAAEQQHFGLVLIGGDSTSGGDRIHATMTCFGVLDGTPLRRNGARIGDDVYVSGALGGAAYALSLLQQNEQVPEALAARYHCPKPRLALGQRLRGIATSAMDISDGLLADAAQIAAASGIGITLQQSTIPLDAHLVKAVQQEATNWRFALSGGDDYELLFTAPAAAREVIAKLAVELQLPLTRIGNVAQHKSVMVQDEAGNLLDISQTGWEY